MFKVFKKIATIKLYFKSRLDTKSILCWIKQESRGGAIHFKVFHEILG